MIVDVIDVDRIFALEAEDDAPVAANVYGPSAFQLSFQRMQAQARQVHVARFGRSVEPSQDEPKSAGMFRSNATCASRLEERSQSLMGPPRNHVRM